MEKLKKKRREQRLDRLSKNEKEQQTTLNAKTIRALEEEGLTVQEFKDRYDIE